ncbi:phosphoethanolamine transferase [Alteromonas sp. CYL-A6]|uniref:phosphoethanolamine transferase n=1 Tax=Alteromonas nitratireducens TaxID=3390813 RepID=UPI0034B41D71
MTRYIEEYLVMLSTASPVTHLSFRCQFPGRHAYRLLIATWLTVVLNQPLFDFLPGHYVLSTGLLLWFMNSIFVYLLTPGRLFVPGIILLTLTSSVASYFISHYGIVIDRSMIQNAMETDSREALELLTPQFFLTVFFGMLPVLALGKVCRAKRPGAKRVAVYVGMFAGLLVTMGTVAGVNYQEYAGFFRQNKQVKHIAIPLNVISATESYVRNNVLATPLPFKQIAPHVTHSIASAQPEVLVVVVGETARADHFPQNGYARNTTPQLSGLNLINFGHVSSCGTATAHSLPCMFSWMGHENYDERIAMSSENVFDIMQRAGFMTAWYDNNSGCKGLCERMPTTNFFELDTCSDGCTDDILTTGLQAFIEDVKRQGQHGVVILHQQGSHGPSYYKRSRPADKRFTPECTSDTFSDCTQDEIINAYDNSLVETDALLSAVISQLSDSGLPASMLYVSDHGESLGENGVYLHGLPYWMAPEEQTHIPMMLWLSDTFSTVHGIDEDCLSSMAGMPQSHDMLFHAILDLTGVDIETAEPVPDGLAQCRSAV